MAPNSDNIPKSRLPIVNNIIGKTPYGDLLLQSAPDIGHLQQRLSAYFERELQVHEALSDTATFQRILHKRALDVPELNIYSFDPDQRFNELAVTISITTTLNKFYKLRAISGWQRAEQKEIMKQFTGKESWDGLIYENGANDTEVVSPVFVEVKSTMISPSEDSKTPNELLGSRLEKYKKHFQSPGSLCAVFIMPYTPEGRQLSFDFKEATEQLNKAVSADALSCVCLLSFPTNQNRKIEMRLDCYIVNKNPALANDGNIQQVTLGRMTLGKL